MDALTRDNGFAKSITLEEWIAQLQALEISQDAFTVAELCDKTGRSRSWAHSTIRDLMSKNMCKLAGRKPIDSISGVKSWAPAYKLVPPPAKDTKAGAKTCQRKQKR